MAGPVASHSGLARRLLKLRMDIANPQFRLQRRRRRLWLAGAGATVVAMAAVALARLGPALPKAERASLWIDAVQRGDMLQEVRATGTLVPRSSRWLAAATAAQVQEILIWPGAAVRPDTVLMRLANPEVEDALREFGVRIAQAPVSPAEISAMLRAAQARVSGCTPVV